MPQSQHKKNVKSLSRYRRLRAEGKCVRCAKPCDARVCPSCNEKLLVYHKRYDEKRKPQVQP